MITRSEWGVLAWLWVALMTCLGIALLIAWAAIPHDRYWTNSGIGTALLLIAASIFFVVVSDLLWALGDRYIAQAASILTAVFVYDGTLAVLSDESPMLLAVVLICTYIFVAGAYIVLSVRFFFRVFNA